MLVGKISSNCADTRMGSAVSKNAGIKGVAPSGPRRLAPEFVPSFPLPFALVEEGEISEDVAVSV